MQGTLATAGQVNNHVVTKVVKAELVVSAIGNISGIGLTTGYRPHEWPRLVFRLILWVIDKALIVLNAAYANTEGIKDRPHPLRVALGKIVINGDKMTTLTSQ